MNKLAASFAVGLAAFSTALIPSKEVSAALTEPASYDYGYKYDAVSETFLAYGDGSPEYSSIFYERTTDGGYYNYLYSGLGGSGQGEWPFEISMTFNRATSNFDSVGGGLWEPYQTTYIGSNNTVGSLQSKIKLEFDNNTFNDYYLYLDFTSFSTTFISLTYTLNSNNYFTYQDYIRGYTDVSPQFITFPIPAFSNVIIDTPSTSATRYFDAWYLQDLGVSESYTAGTSQGYIDGYAGGLGNNPNVLLNGFETVIGIFVNFVLMIATFDIFGVSIMNILLVFVTVIGLVWILKVLRG